MAAALPTHPPMARFSTTPGVRFQSSIPIHTEETGATHYIVPCGNDHFHDLMLAQAGRRQEFNPITQWNSRNVRKEAPGQITTELLNGGGKKFKLTCEHVAERFHEFTITPVAAPQPRHRAARQLGEHDPLGLQQMNMAICFLTVGAIVVLAGKMLFG